MSFLAGDIDFLGKCPIELTPCHTVSHWFSQKFIQLDTVQDFK